MPPSNINVAVAAACVIGFTIILASRYQLGAYTAFPSPSRSEKTWNQLYHLGGESPWIQRLDDVVSARVEPPAGCQVEQAHLLSRHGERYPTASSGLAMLNLVKRLKEYGNAIGGLKDDLAFVNDWTYFANDPSQELEQLVATGPYAGTLQAFNTGVKLRTRYNSLIPDSKLRFWASNSSRVIDTARYFGEGFFGLDWEDSVAELEIISEEPDLGGDSLTPVETCLAYDDDTEGGHQHGQEMLQKWGAKYLPDIAARFNKANRGINITASEVYSMQEMCGFGIIATGSSPWCDAFTHDEWLSFEYARDLLHYYRTGYGNKYGPAIGWLWVDATRDLLLAGPSNGTLFFSFTHDTTLMATITALGTFKVDKPLSVTKRPDDRYWKTSQTAPMGGRLILERLFCPNAEPASINGTKSQNLFVRVNINDGVVAIPGCNSGPGHSCLLDKFSDWISRQGKEAGEFPEICKLRDVSPKRITFLHQPAKQSKVR